MKVIIHLLLTSLFVCVVTCHHKKKLTKEEKEFKIKVTNLITDMNSIYIKTTKKLQNSDNSQRAIKILDIHIKAVSKNNEEMLYLEINDPELFQKQEKNPPKESETLKNSVEKFSLLMTKLSQKYRIDPDFLRMYQKIFKNFKERASIIKRTLNRLITEKISYCENMLLSLQNIKRNQNELSTVKTILINLKKNDIKLRNFQVKFPDIIEAQKKTLIFEENKIIKVNKEIFTEIDRLFTMQKTDNSLNLEDLKKIQKELKLLIREKTFDSLGL